MNRHVPPLLLSAMLGASCAPGEATVQSADSGTVDAPSSTDTDESSPPDATTELDMPTGADTDAAADVTSDDAATDADADDPFPPSPQRFFTAETDGTISWGTHDYAAEQLVIDGSIERGGRISFLAFSDDGERLFATNETRVEAFDITGEEPQFLGDGEAGIGGTHLEADHTGQWLLVASYGGDAVSMLPIGADGDPADATVTLGGDADPDFCQNAHQVRVHPGNEFAYVPCLGSDHVAILGLDAENGTLQSLASADTPAGSGPRHMDFHPTRPLAYVIGELDDTVTIFEIDEQTGMLSQRNVVSTRPSPDDPLGPASDIHVSADGDFVVGINRDPRNEVVVFQIDDQGDLTETDRVSTSGDHARTFAFAPGGRRLLVGNSNSMDVALFDFSTDGTLTHLSNLEEFDARLFYVGFPR